MKHPGARRHCYRFSEVVRAARLSASGHSAQDIADALGHGATARRVYGLLQRHDLPLIKKSKWDRAFVIVISARAMEEYERLCEPFGADPQQMVARAAEYLTGDSAVLREIVKEIAES